MPTAGSHNKHRRCDNLSIWPQVHEGNSGIGPLCTAGSPDVSLTVISAIPGRPADHLRRPQCAAVSVLGSCGSIRMFAQCPYTVQPSAWPRIWWHYVSMTLFLLSWTCVCVASCVDYDRCWIVWTWEICTASLRLSQECRCKCIFVILDVFVLRHLEDKKIKFWFHLGLEEKVLFLVLTKKSCLPHW